MRTGCPVPFEEAGRLAAEALRGLHALHEAGVIHRDVKPENLLLTVHRRLKVADLGIATREDPASAGVTQTGALIGTPAYMAPEQILGQRVTSASDVYAVGLILLEMLLGRPLRTFRTLLEVLEWHQNPVDLPVRELLAVAPAGAVRWIPRLLERDPRRRPASAREAAGALEKEVTALLHARIRARPAPEPEPPLSASTALQPAAPAVPRASPPPPADHALALRDTLVALTALDDIDRLCWWLLFSILGFISLFLGEQLPEFAALSFVALVLVVPCLRVVRVIILPALLIAEHGLRAGLGMTVPDRERELQLEGERARGRRAAREASTALLRDLERCAPPAPAEPPRIAARSRVRQDPDPH